VPHPGHPAARGHLRLAGASPERRRASESRVLLGARAVLGAAILLALTAVAWIVAFVALLPLAWRRAPVGVRMRPLRPPEARIIPFERGRVRERALPR
jgi:hypothetical protein